MFNTTQKMMDERKMAMMDDGELYVLLRAEMSEKDVNEIMAYKKECSISVSGMLTILGEVDDELKNEVKLANQDWQYERYAYEGT